LAAGLVLLGFALVTILRTLHQRRASRLMVATAAGEQQPAILYFRSDHCAPCLAQSHHLQQLQRDLNGRLAVREIDAEREIELAAHYGIFTLPTTLITDGRGQVKHINYGLAATATLARQLENI
jgi:thiol-disulfide isomerase/thioredoxin